MILNFWSFLFTSFFNCTIFFFLYILVLLSNYYVFFFDFPSRFLTLDFFVNNGYLFWTNSSYLYLFIFTMLYILNTFIYRDTNMWFIKIINITVVILLLIGLLNYWNLNSNLLINNNFNANINTLLTNSINKYHPLFFYSSSLIVLLYIFYFFVSYNIINTSLFNWLYFFKSTSLYFLIILFGTLYLGSWWALQEGSWGGWWNWDPSEVFGLVIVLFFLLFIHCLCSESLWCYSQLMKVIVYSYLVLYFFIQLNFNLVSHNFGTRVDWFITSDIWYYFYLLLSLIIIFFFFNNVIFYFKNFIFFDKTTRLNTLLNKTLINFLIIIVFLFQIVLSFSFLLNDFIWKLFSVNTFNNLFFININFLIYSLLSFLFLLTYSLDLRILLLLVYVFIDSINIFFLITTLIVFNPLFSSFRFTHLLIILFIQISYISNLNFLSIYNSNLYYEFFISLNNSMIETFMIKSYDSTHLELISNLYTFELTTCSNQSFLSVINNYVLVQNLYVSFYIFSNMISILEFSTPNLNLIFISLILFFYSIIFKKY